MTETLTGSVERITYYNQENGYSVVRLKAEGRARSSGVGRDGLVTVTGNLPELTPGEHVRLTGEWMQHSTYGMQFQTQTCEQILPATVDGIRRYLGSGLVKGIGPRLAERIVDTFGSRTLEVIEASPEELLRVPDIGRKRLAGIQTAWDEQKQVKDIMLFLHSHGIATGLAVKIYKHYGGEALQVVRADPYRLARDIFGIGFKTADRIAQALGLPQDHPSRLEAGVIYVLNQAADEGHAYLPRPEAVSQAATLLEVPPEQVEPAVDRLTQAERTRLDWLPVAVSQSTAVTGELPAGEATRETGTRAPEISSHPGSRAPKNISESPSGYPAVPAVYLAPFYYSETGLAGRLRSLASTIPSRLSDIPPAFTPLDETLSPEQGQAIRTALSSPVSVLTGGPGTGKTTAMKALIAIVEAAGKRFALASPTGRAAKRLSQATGRPAATIHRLLGYSPAEGFKHTAENPLPVDLLVIDEASMLDLHLAYNLIKAIEPGTHLLLVGDVDQLPSVGAGDVLRDIIRSGEAPVTRLSVIFRQAAGSHIITNAHRINQGKSPVFPASDPSQRGGGPGGTQPDFFLFPAETPEQAADWVIEVTTRRIPQRFGLHPLHDIQVLAPMYRGPAGVSALNERLQEALNPPAPNKPEKRLFGQLYRLGDKLMQVQNNYDKDVFNGDIGFVREMNTIDHSLSVDFDGRMVSYDFTEADQLVPAYAVSVHKSQGAEFPAVVIPLVTQHYLMLQRNLLYTAITRARKLCVLVGSKRAIYIAVRNDRVAHRYTALAYRLESGGS